MRVLSGPAYSQERKAPGLLAEMSGHVIVTSAGRTVVAGVVVWSAARLASPWMVAADSESWRSRFKYLVLLSSISMASMNTLALPILKHAACR